MRRRRYPRVASAVLLIVVVAAAYVRRVMVTTEEPGAWVAFAGVVFLCVGVYSAARLRASTTKERMVARLALVGVEPDAVGWCVVYDETVVRGGLRAYVVLEAGRLRFFDDSKPFDMQSGPTHKFDLEDRAVVTVTVSRALFGLGRTVELHRDGEQPVRLWTPVSTLTLLEQHYAIVGAK